MKLKPLRSTECSKQVYKKLYSAVLSITVNLNNKAVVKVHFWFAIPKGI